MKSFIIDNWKFLLTDIIIPILTLIIGFFSGIKYEKRKSTNRIKVKGNNNNISQGNILNKK